MATAPCRMCGPAQSPPVTSDPPFRTNVTTRRREQRGSGKRQPKGDDWSRSTATCGAFATTGPAKPLRRPTSLSAQGVNPPPLVPADQAKPLAGDRHVTPSPAGAMIAAPENAGGAAGPASSRTGPAGPGPRRDARPTAARRQLWLKKPFSTRRAFSSAETSTLAGVSRKVLSAIRCMPPSRA